MLSNSKWGGDEHRSARLDDAVQLGPEAGAPVAAARRHPIDAGTLPALVPGDTVPGMTDFAETERSSATRLEVKGEIAGRPDDVWRAFIDPAILTSWWPQEAETDPVVGGSLEMRWPAMDWTR